MSVIPCTRNEPFIARVEEYVEALKVQAHTIGTHGLDEKEFYNAGFLRAAVEILRGEYVATMRDKWGFAEHVLNYMQDAGFVREWESAGGANRHDYSVVLASGKVAAIELKGCLDGNNTNIFERPPHAQEFIIWSVCTNPAADPRKNAWSGIHTRLSAEIIAGSKRVDGVVIWDMICGSTGRPCPKLGGDESRLTTVGPFKLTPPCIYLFPATVPHPRNNPSPPAQDLAHVQILKAFHECFGGRSEELNLVTFAVEYRGTDTMRTTRVVRGGATVRESKATAIKRT